MRQSADGLNTGLVDGKVEAAFRAVSATCGLDATASRRLWSHPGAAGKIRALAGTSPEYQRHVVGRLLAGDPNPFPQVAATLLVYDTVGFREVTSRLHRALGMVRKEAEYLNAKIAEKARPDRLPDRLLTLDLIAEQAGTLGDLLGGVEAVPGASGSGAKGRRSSAREPGAGEKLHAAGALGLVAKNVRNVALLQPTHRPSFDEKRTALTLTKEVRWVAATTWDAARKAFGHADDACRVRPRRRPVRRVITHSEPDGDAVAGAWLAERFLFADEPVEILLLPRERALGAYRRGDCLVDVGNTHDPANFFFDHKPPALPDRHDACAAQLIWDHLRAAGRKVERLKTLVRAVLAGDSARQRVRYLSEYNRSTADGFHAALARARAAEATDAGVYRAVRRWLDRNYPVEE